MKKGRPKKRKPRSSKIKYKVGDKVMANIFGEVRLGVVESLTELDGVKLYNLKIGNTKYPYVGVDGNGNFWNIDSKLTKIKTNG